MISNTTVAPSSRSAERVRSDALATTAFITVKPDPARFAGSLHEWLGLEARVLASPLPKTPNSTAATRISQRWNDAHARIFEASADDALKIVQNASEACFDHYRGGAKLKVAGLDYDLYDPGTKLMQALYLASRCLFYADATGKYPNVDGIDKLAQDLLSFHEARYPAQSNDARLIPIRSMARCLQTLVRILRDEA